MKALRQFILLAAGLLVYGSLAAQSLPALEKAKEITTGCLPDGISYYLISNASTPGFADFALVQPLRKDIPGPRMDLVQLPHFQDRKPYEFLAANSVGYGQRGFIQHLRDATVFRFSDVPVSQSEVADSTLLMLFDIARSSQYEQALVVSGNIDVTAIIERIRILSMTLSRRSPADSDWSYGWTPQDRAMVTTSTSPVAGITVHYRSPRTEPELMNTIQPLMSRLLASELNIVLQRRLRAAFIDAGVPLADYRYRYTGSDQTSGDELFSLSVFTAPESLEDAVRTIAGVLSALDSDGATLEEVMFARSVLSEAAARDDDNYKMSNAEYVDKCVSAYLYGSNLASYAAVSSFFTGRRLDAGRERELLNRYVAAMLAPDRNLHLRISAPAQPDADRMKALFAEGWKQGSSAVSDIPVASDTLKLVSPRKKVKLKNTSTDAFSGGKMWTFSNGISVIYKKTADKGSFQYGFMVKGGWPEIPGIKGSEPAFAQDVIRLSKVGGMSATHLQDLLAMYGVTMEPQLSLTDVRLVGTAPTASLSLVLKTMLTVAGNTEPDPEAYSRYRKEKAVRLVRDKFSEEGTRAVLDSIMCPGYAYAAGSLPKPPAEGYEIRVNQYLTQKGSSFKNGVIVLIGDLNEGITLKLLTHCLGELKTGQQRASRPRMQYPLRECWTTNSVLRDWRSHGVSVSLSTLWPFGADGNIKLQLACALLQARLDEALCTDGMYSSVTAFSDLLPAEKLSVHIHCEPVLTSGLPADVKPAPPVHALQTVRSVINGLASTEVDAATLARAKTMLTNRFKAGENDPALLRDAVLWRNSLGRDINSGYAQRLKAVKASEIRELFAALMKSDCEYVVQ